jgi:hypothetical protein
LPERSNQTLLAFDSQGRLTLCDLGAAVRSRHARLGSALEGVTRVRRIDRRGELVSILRRAQIGSSLAGSAGKVATGSSTSAGTRAERTVDSPQATVSSRLPAVEGGEPVADRPGGLLDEESST